MSSTRNPWGLATRVSPRRRPARAAEGPAACGSQRTLVTRVSKVANAGACSASSSTDSSHSRSPVVARCAGAPWRTASARVLARLMLNACVGPPTTRRSTSAARRCGAEWTSTRPASMPSSCSPRATAPAIFSVLPNIDSNTTRALMVPPLMTGLPHHPRRAPCSWAGAEVGARQVLGPGGEPRSWTPQSRAGPRDLRRLEAAGPDTWGPSALTAGDSTRLAS